MNQRSFSLNIDSEGKNIVVAYLLWWFLGWAGIHRFYLGKVKTGIAQLVLQVIGWVTSVILIGFVFLFIWLVWWLIDAYFVYRIVTESNQKLGLSSSGITVNTIQKSNNNFEQLEKLHDIYVKGIITKEQYESKKSELI